MITVIAGGVGAARFLQGLLAVQSPSQVTIVSNVGDDAEFFGLHVSPDIDSVLYHLSGLADEERGFGITGDTYAVLEALPRYGYDTWFKLGDRDLATCLARTHLLRRGKTLTEATAELADALMVPVTILPVTNDRLRTMIRTDDEVLEFQEYFVKRRTEGHAREIILEGVDKAAPSPGVIEAIREADGVIISPSNPLVSIAPALAVAGVREALRETEARVAAVSPIVGGRALKGPADRMLRDQGMEASAVSIARLYEDFLDVLVIDETDEALAPKIEALGVDVVVTDTIMKSMAKKSALARTVLAALGAK
ncbi:MAG: 2-phospho-L-lactate transferase [Chloroflexi bacterium]|nr:2-phospho-L-lactate transferase [Chloroflexota bacterium]